MDTLYIPSTQVQLLPGIHDALAGHMHWATEVAPARVYLSLGHWMELLVVYPPGQ
jgi:hypothetical protein